MNTSAVLKLEFFSLALHQWNYQFVETVARFIYVINQKINNFVVRALLCARPRGNGSRSLKRSADWYQVEKSFALPGASVARYPYRASFLEQKCRRVSDQLS